MTTCKDWAQRLRVEVAKAVLGQEEVIEKLLVALLANGHVLIEGMPGLAKTLLVRSLGSALGIQCDRIQFTPDLLPTDVVGTMIFSPKTGEFTTHKGPIFANMVLADEINRAPAKVQSALLEAMQERTVTIGGETHKVPQPFFVMATQNPVEQDGTYPLPEAQIDRFLFKLLVEYPSFKEEATIMERWGQVTKAPKIEAVSSGEELLALRSAVDQVYVSPQIRDYILTLVRATREFVQPNAAGKRYANFGASPRASLALYTASRALACIRGSDHVTPQLVQDVLPDAMRHRMSLTYEAEAEELTATKLLQRIIEQTPLPAVEQAA
jgi:MoxR-like ATPase